MGVDPNFLDISSLVVFIRRCEITRSNTRLVSGPRSSASSAYGYLREVSALDSGAPEGIAGRGF